MGVKINIRALVRAFLHLMLVGLLILPGEALAYEVPNEIKDGVKSALEKADINEWDGVFSSLPDEVRALWGNASLEDMVSDYALGDGDYLGAVMENGLIALFKGAIPNMLPLLVSLLAVAVLSGFLRAMSSAGMKGLNDIAGFVCQCFAIGIAISAFISLAKLADESIQKTGDFIELAFPALLTLLSASGGIAAASIFHPAMALLIGGVSAALRRVVLPIIMFGGVMGVLNNITGRVQLGNLYALCKTVSKWLIGLLFTLYFGVTTLQGMTAAAFDGVSIRTAKFAIDKLVPIVGGMVSGTVDTVMGCALLVKNAAGLAAILLAFGIVCMPVIKIAVGMITFRLAAAIIEPIGDERMPRMLSSIGEILSYLFAAALTLSVMFMITVGLIMGVSAAAITGG